MKQEDELRNIKNPIIKGERPIYHLITEEKLNEIISNSFIGSLFFGLFSILAGVSITEKNWIYFLISLIFLTFSIYLYICKIRSILKIKKSAEVQSYEFDSINQSSSKLEILKSFYGTFPNKVVDVTERIKGFVADNKINTNVTNDNLVQEDPDPGVIKSLEVEYKIGNQKIKKSFREHGPILIP